ncbi:MAG TPA: IclR family transcriptional regulator C-terminal domain-containing protein [Solirubrobacteraceae bacterium]|nr:IclR family transcriptional regulator C-terminal domain-containing protein [Solirubrobacteraceae bacterium]
MPARWARSCSPTTPTWPASSRATAWRGSPPATITDAESLERELERVRQRGWAADIGELVNGEVSCAAPILDRRGVTVGAMGVSGPPDRLLAARQPRGDVVAFVREAARAVSRELGAIPW